MAEKTRCEKCNRIFKNLEGLEMHNSAKHKANQKIDSKVNYKITKGWIVFIIFLIILTSSIYFLVSNLKTLPPIDPTGHIEDSPKGHILKGQMPLAIQKHMLEHSDGDGPAGRIINYNCEDYNCEKDLIEKLEAFAIKYPSKVYVSPFENMDAKIVLTKNGEIEILENYDGDKINRFVR